MVRMTVAGIGGFFLVFIEAYMVCNSKRLRIHRIWWTDSIYLHMDDELFPSVFHFYSNQTLV